MIDEKYKSGISIVCLVLAIIFIITALFIKAPNRVKETAASKSREYVLNKDKVMEINIQVEDSDWRWLMENATKEEYRKADVTINGETFYNVGIRPKGNSSLSSVARDSDSDRFSLKIDFSEYMEGQTYHGFEKLALNNMMSDTTYMKEYLSYELYDYLDVPTPEYSYSNIKVNGEEWGLYLAVEVIEENFVQKEFGSSVGNLYKPESMEVGGGDMQMGGAVGQNRNNLNGGGFQRPQQNFQQQGSPVNTNGADRGFQRNGGFGGGSKGGANLKYIDDNPSSYSVVRDGAIFKKTTDKEFEKVIEMIKNLNYGTKLEEYLDVEEILKYFAVNTFLVNLDSYSGGMYHNYYLYEKDGMFSILPWDLNMSFAGFSMSMGSGGNSNGAQRAVNFPIDKPVTGNLEDAPLIGNLLKVDKYKELYHSYLKKIVDEYINSGVFEASASKIDTLISNYVKTDATAFYTYDEYKKSIPELINFGKDRAVSVESQLSGSQPSENYGNIETRVNLSSLGSMQMGGQRGVGGEQASGEGGEKPTMGGQMPGMGDQMPNMENMPSQENMMEIMSILNEADINNLTDEEKDKLKALGVDENMLNMFKNRMQGGMAPMNNDRQQMNNNRPQRNNVISRMNSGSGYTMTFIFEGAAILVVLLIGMIFAFKYKRKKRTT